jgi:drug/metabolite transporter (DMT)-like permease
MNNPLTIAILAGVGGMLGWGAADFFAKKAVDRIGPLKSLVWAHGFGAVLFVLAALGQVFLLKRAVPMPSGGAAWLGLAGFGALQMLVYWLVYQGFEKGQLAILNPIFASFAGLVALFAIVGFGEAVSPRLIAAFIVLFIGIILINSDIDSLKRRRINIVPGLKEIAAATLLAAIWTLGWDRFVSGQNSLSYALWMYAFMTLAAVALARLVRAEVSGVPVGLWKFLLLMGLGEMVAYLAISWGYSSTSLTGVVALISGAFSVPTVILAYLFLKERISKLQWAAIVIIIAGIIGVSLG